MPLTSIVVLSRFAFTLSDEFEGALEGRESGLRNLPPVSEVLEVVSGRRECR